MVAQKDKQRGILQSVDWLTIAIYIALLGLGWMSVCGASYEFGQGLNFFDFSTRSGMQIVWIKGSMSWIKIGSFSIQPAEFAKFATALCVSKYMSSSDFNISRWWNFLLACILVVLPMGLIVMQRETGSALVYTAFFLMFYREGMSGCILFAGVSAVVYFVVGVRFAADPLWGVSAISMGHFMVLLLILLFTVGMMRLYTERIAPVLRVLLYGVGLTLAALFFSKYVIPFDVTWVQLGVCLIMVGYLFWLAVKERYARYANEAGGGEGGFGAYYIDNDYDNATDALQKKGYSGTYSTYAFLRRAIQIVNPAK